MPYKIRPAQKKQTLPHKVEALREKYKTAIAPASRRPKLTSSIIALLVITLIFVPAYSFFKRHNETKAWDMEREASRFFYEKPTPLSEADKKDPSKKEESQSERWQKAASLYDEVSRRYSSTQAAAIAQYNAGNVYFDLEKYDMAEQRYLAFLKKQSNRKDLIPMVHLRLAYLYEKKKDNAKALDHLRVAYEAEGGLSQDQAGFEKGNLLEKMGNKKDAMTEYKAVSQKFTDSPWGAEAAARLAMLDPASATSMTTSTRMQGANVMQQQQGMPGIPGAVTSLPLGMTPPPRPPQSVLPALPMNVKQPIAPMPSMPMPKAITMKPPVPAAISVVPAAAPLTVAPSTAVPAAATPPSTSTPIPLEITPEMLKMLREKGSLTIPLPPSAVSTEAPAPTPAPPVTQKEPEVAKPVETPKAETPPADPKQ